MINEKKNTFLIQGSIIAGASIICRIIGLFYRIKITNIFGDKGNGIYGYAFDIYNIALLLSSFSLPLIISKLISEKLKKNEKINAKRIFNASMIFAITIGFLFFIIIFIFSKQISINFFKSPSSEYSIKTLSFGVFFVALLGVLRGFFQGFGKMIYTAISQIIEQVINALVSIFATIYFYNYGLKLVENDKNSIIPAAYGATGATLGTVVGGIAALIFLIIIYFYKKKEYSLKDRYINYKVKSYESIFKILFKNIIPIVLSASIVNLINVVDPYIFNNIMYSKGYNEKIYSSLYGMYSGKYMQLSNIPLSISYSIAIASAPILSALFVNKNYKEIRKKIHLTLIYSMIISIPTFFGFITIGSQILNMIWNDSNVMMCNILFAGSFMIILYSISTITNICLQSLNYMLITVLNGVISFILHIITLYIFLKYFNLGIYSIIISGTIFALSMCILNQIFLRKILNYTIDKINIFIKPFIASLLMTIVILIFNNLIKHLCSNTVTTISTLILAIISYSIFLIFIYNKKIFKYIFIIIKNKIKL